MGKASDANYLRALALAILAGNTVDVTDPTTAEMLLEIADRLRAS